MFIFSQK